MKEEFLDEDLGKVYIKRSTRAKNMIARRKVDGIEMTVPIMCSMYQVRAGFEQMKPRLLNLHPKIEYIIDLDTNFKTISFSLKLENRSVKNYYASLKDNVLHIICPSIDDFTCSDVQSILKNTIEQAMRKEAKRIFPNKLDRFAKLHGFEYTGLTINKSRSRWGSCSSKKKINLSYFCLFLPEHLIDFIILHELCHTVEMNHGERFWTLLDSVTDNKARLLTLELKKVSLPW